MTGVAAGIAGGSLLIRSADEHYEEYLEATTATQAESLHDDTTGRWAGAWVLIGAAIVLWLANVVDAPIGASSRPRIDEI